MLASAAVHLHFLCISTCICNVSNGKERVSPGSRWKATQLQKIKQEVGEPSLKGKKAGRQIRKGGSEPGGKLPGPPWAGGSSGLLYRGKAGVSW